MAVVAKVFSRATGTDFDVETLSILLIFCGVGLTVSVTLARMAWI